MNALKRLLARLTLLRFLGLLGLIFGAANPALAALLACDGPFFVDAIAESAWVNIDLSAAAGTSGIRQALATARDTYPNQAVRIRLAPGVYQDDLGSEIYAHRLLRSATTPIYLQATDPAPNATQLGHGINLLGVSYIAIDGVTIGPPVVGPWNGSVHAAPLPLQAAAGIHVYGAAINASANANVGGTLDTSIYGQYEPAHHILIRSVTIQNLFDPADLDAETAVGYGSDGIKFNQAEDVWVINSGISQTTRHGIDNVGLHRGAFCNNVIAHNGGGLGIEAKGGSTDVLYDSNVFYRVRRVELGGENTDATYYFSLDGRWDYEALGTVARNNLIIDPRESALEFSGCADCLAIGNSILFTPSYVPPLEGNEAAGGDAIRIHDSVVSSAADGAGNDCQSWDTGLNDYVTIDPCWGVGANLPAPVHRVLRTSAVTVQNNLFAASGGHFGHSYGGTTVACPLNVIDGNAALLLKANYWWNGASALPSDQCSPLPVDAASVGAAGQTTASPLLALPLLETVSLADLTTTAPLALTPASNSPLAGRAVPHAMTGTADFKKLPRASPASIGAIEVAVQNPGGNSQTIGSIAFSPATLAVGGSTTANATATSGLAVSFGSTTATICSVSGSTVTGLAVGTCTVAANQAGNSTYSAAPQVTQNINVASAPARLINLSTRGPVQTGDNVMIGGFVIGGSTPKKVLIRAVGPNLANYGVTGVLADPTLQLFSGQTPIASNNDWGSASNAAEVQAANLAPVNSLESAILATLNPGAYTAIVSGVSNGTGVAIIEVYDLDHPETPLINISTRGKVLTGDGVMIGGFIIQGDSPQTVLIRAGGPTLANYGVTGALADPMLELHRSSDGAVIDSNNNWGTASNAAAIAATGLAPANALESAILISLPPGAYTAIVSGSGSGTGVAIVEVYAQ